MTANDQTFEDVVVAVLALAVIPQAAIRFFGFGGASWAHALHAVAVVALIGWVLFGWRVRAALDGLRADRALQQMEE
jgi:hypothetical protein